VSTGKRRSNGQLARDRLKISDLYLQGWLQVDIAEEVGISTATVCRDISYLQEAWQQSSLVNIDAKKAEELAKVDRLEREYWRAWVRSCEDAETIRQEGSKNIADEKVKPVKIVKTAKGQAGDPRFLAGVQWCINKRCEILGIDAPKKIAGPDGGDLNIIVRYIDEATAD